MPLESQNVQLSFAAGVDESTDKHHLPPGKLLRAENARLSKVGAIEKRLGIELLATVENEGDSARLVVRDQELVTITTRGDVYARTETTSEPVARGHAPAVAALRRPVAATPSFPESASVAYGVGMLAFAWVDNGSALYRIEDRASGATIETGTLAPLVDATGIRVAFVDGRFMFVYPEASTTNIFGRSFVASTLVMSAEATVANDNRAGGEADISPMSDRLVVVYQPDATTDLRVFTVDTSFAVVDSLSLETVGLYDKLFLSIHATEGEYVWVSWIVHDAGAGMWRVYVTCLGSDLLGEVAGFPFDVTLLDDATGTLQGTGICRFDEGSAVLLIRGLAFTGGPANYAYMYHTRIDDDGTVGIPLVRRRTNHVFPSSRPWVYDNRAYAVVQTASQGASSFVVAELGIDADEDDVYQAKPGSGLLAARFAFGAGAIPTDIADVGGGSFVACLSERRSNDGRTAMFAAELGFEDRGRWQSAPSGDTIVMTPNGVYDGVATTEVSFVHRPFVLADFPGVLGDMAAGEYHYVVVYEDIDARGNIARGQPSDPYPVTVASSGDVELRVSTLCLTFRSQVNLVLYRSEVDAGADGPFYRCASAENDPNAAYVTFFDTLADSGITSNAQVYTAGAVLENVAPPAMQHITAHAGRLFCIGDDGRTLFFTKSLIEGEQASFCDEFNLPLPATDRGTGLLSMDGNLLLWTRGSIFVLPFDAGPNELGTGPEIPLPRRLATDLGCIAPRSIVLMPAGAIFQSSAGLYLLSRGLEVGFVGLPVEDTLAANPTITSALGHPSESTVSFTCVGEEAGARLVFDYRIQQWTVDKLQDGARFVSQAVAAGRVFLLDPAGGLYRERLDDWRDDDAEGAPQWVTLRVAVANIAVGGIQGYQRVRRVQLLAEQHTAHDLTLALSADYADAAAQVRTWTATQLEGQPREQMRMHVTRQRMAAIRVEISDAAPTGDLSVGSGRGCSLIGLALEIGVLPKAARLPRDMKR
jgi:hypothetical protein